MTPLYLFENFLPKTRIAIVEIPASNEIARAQLHSQYARIAADIAAQKNLEITKDEFGKPIVSNANFNLSLSHSKQWAAAAVSKEIMLGIDIETIENRIERVAHKFLKKEELEAIKKDRVETLILYWSAKESLYKLYSKKQLDFAEQLLIEPFTLQNKGSLHATISLKSEQAITGLTIKYQFIKNHVLTAVGSEL